MVDTDDWVDDYAEDADEVQIDEYDITASPNDFNVLTIYNFLEAGSVRIPGFQRNFVWDLGRASKLIESLLLGLPVPQIFLYEAGRNEFLVIDGQQRLMSIYYFVKQRFPRKEKRAELRAVFDDQGKIPDPVLENSEYFEDFRLKLPESLPSRPNRFKGLTYSTLSNYKTQFDLRTIRNVIIKQNSPQDDDSSMYEVFNRLNTGGINLKPFRAFLELGNERNRLVHENYATFPMEKTLEEVYALYKKSCLFVDALPAAFEGVGDSSEATC
jgi:uncharacterized protein with ParB-like and HNH nuclease domain